jgi:FkbM family methyltransferase
MIKILRSEVQEDGCWNITFNYSGDIEKEVDAWIEDISTGLVVFGDHWKLTPGSTWWFSLSPYLYKHLFRAELRFDDMELGVHELFLSGRSRPFTMGPEIIYPSTKKDPSFQTFVEVKIDEVYNRGPVKVLPGDVVLDIGANYGFFSLYAVERGAAMVYALEPYGPTYECLKRNVSDYQVRPLNLGISKTLGESDFVVSKISGSNHLVDNQSSTGTQPNESNVVKVRVYPINTIINSIGLECIDFLKVDCEGGELDLFETISDENLKKVQKTVVEYHTKEIGEFVLGRLVSSGFTLYGNTEIGDIGLIYAYR